jgi:hypothetical protein
MNDEDRLYRIERALIDMSDKFDRLLRLEERHNALSERVALGDDRIHKHANLIMSLQQVSSLNTKSVGQFEKLAYMLVGSVFAAVAYFVFETIAH